MIDQKMSLSDRSKKVPFWRTRKVRCWWIKKSPLLMDQRRSLVDWPKKVSFWWIKKFSCWWIKKSPLLMDQKKSLVDISKNVPFWSIKKSPFLMYQKKKKKKKKKDYCHHKNSICLTIKTFKKIKGKFEAKITKITFIIFHTTVNF